MEIVEKLTQRNDIYENFDPVLMHDFSELEKKPIAISNYLIVYAYRGRLTKEEEEAIKKFAKIKQKQIVCIGGYHKFCDIYIQESPLRIFDYFRKADYVITDTFHGTIFSVINHAKVGVFVRSGHGKKYGNSEKLLDLLKKLQLEDRIITNIELMDNILDKEIDYNSVDAIIAKERQQAINYLNQSL